jgi:hypothetical protein
MSYRDDRAFGEKFIPEIKRLISPHLFMAAPVDIDRQEATDLVVLLMRDFRIACRVRRPGYSHGKFRYQFTLRSRRDNGRQTELAKVTDGFCEFLFYGHSTPSGTISPWMLIDLKAFRGQLIRQSLQADDPPTLLFGQQSNGDGTHFVWFDIRSFAPSPKLLVATDLELSPALLL